MQQPYHERQRRSSPLSDPEQGLLASKNEARRPNVQTGMLTKWLIVLAITGFVLLDVYLVDVVVSRAAFKQGPNVHTVISAQQTIRTRMQPQRGVTNFHKGVVVMHDSSLQLKTGQMEQKQSAQEGSKEPEVVHPVLTPSKPSGAELVLEQAVPDRPAVAEEQEAAEQQEAATVAAVTVAPSGPPPAAARHIPVAPELLAVRLAHTPMFIGHSAPAPDHAPDPSRPTDLPADFDWEAYLEYNPDLKAFGVSTQELAQTHFMSWGFTEARVYSRLRVLLRYTACGGLMNQHYSHIAALTLATYLGVDVVVPPAVKRDSFANYFSTDAKLSKISWQAAPFNSLWDEEYIFDNWKGLKGQIALVPEDAPSPNLLMPRTAFQSYSIDGIKPEQVVQLDGLYVSSQEFAVVVEKARRLLVERAVQLQKQVDKHRKEFPPLVLDLPCMLFSMRTNELRLASVVARQLHFSPYIQELADKVIAAMAAKGVTTFHGLHLRVEQDAVDWAMILGGRDALWSRYLDRCAAAGMNKTAGLYIATGLLSYSDQREMNLARQRLAPYASQLLYKEQYLEPRVLASLHPEQQALIDFLVLVRSRHFVGISVSTFSVFIREYRHIHSIQPRSTSFLVDGTRIGTEPLFARSAVLP